MSPTTILVTALILFVYTDGVLGENLLSASVQWIPVNQNKVRFTYHLAWKQTPVKLCPVPNTALRCAAYLDGTFRASNRLLQKWLGDFRWECTEGCSPVRVVANLTELYYKNVSTFGDVSWESAVETVEIDFGVMDDMEKIQLRFFRPDHTPIGGIGPVQFGRAMRQDTNRTNIGPLVNVLPFYSVPIGESVQFGIHPYDGDGDYVRCKWDMPVPSAAIQLDQDNCLLHIDTQSTSEFRVAQEIQLSLYAEDYTCNPVQFGGDTGNFTTGPFSRAPFMITIVIGPAVKNRTTAVTSFNDVRFEQNAVTLLRLPIRSFKTKFAVTHGNTRHYLATGPRFMKFQTNNAQTTVEALWNVNNEPLMTGIHQACVMFYDSQGLSVTDSRCAILFIGGEDKCRSNPCQDGGICQSWYNYSMCLNTERTPDCNNESPGVSDFLQKYLHYLIYGGSGVFGLLALLLALCICMRCCCVAAKEKKQAKRKATKVRPRYPDPDW